MTNASFDGESLSSVVVIRFNPRDVRPSQTKPSLINGRANKQRPPRPRSNLCSDPNTADVILTSKISYKTWTNRVFLQPDI